MKLRSLLGLTSVALSSWAIAQFQYQCLCQDTGLECDGMEKLTILGFNEMSVFTYADTKGNHPVKFETFWDQNYQPISASHQGYKKFSITQIQPLAMAKEYDLKKTNFLV